MDYLVKGNVSIDGKYPIQRTWRFNLPGGRKNLLVGQGPVQIRFAFGAFILFASSGLQGRRWRRRRDLLSQNDLRRVLHNTNLPVWLDDVMRYLQ